ncbi:hypothetical protein J3459_017920 [Metarhizium acridum]|nr:hypothetical protein J3459_017920 [Metarhizium acridum]
MDERMRNAFNGKDGPESGYASENRHRRQRRIHTTLGTYDATEEIFFVDGAEKPPPAEFPRHGRQGLQKREGEGRRWKGTEMGTKGVWVRVWQSLCRLRARFPESCAGWIQ